jgi:predicted dehydrogenase
MEKKFRAVLVGLGNIAWRFDQNIRMESPGLTHLFAYERNPHTKLVGGCSPEREDRLSFEKALNIPAYNSIEEMIDRLSPDIVSICSPTEFHFEHALYCLKKEVPMIWLEKPPTESLSQLDRLIEEKKRHGGKSTVLVNFQRRYTECYIKLQSLYQRETLGKCRFIHLTYSRGLNTNGSHLLDMLFFVIGDTATNHLEWVEESKNIANPSFVLSFEDGPEVTVSGIELPYHCIDITLTFDKGRASILYGGVATRVEEKIEHEIFPGFYRLKEGPPDLLGSGGFEHSMEEALRDLIESFEESRLPKSSLITSRKTMVLIEEVTRKQKAE